jgi:hypothetical protein
MQNKRKRAQIDRELPPVGTILNGKFKGKPYKAKIVSDKASSTGRGIKYEGDIYQSMSAAAKAITRQSTNGWRFWKF